MKKNLLFSIFLIVFLPVTLWAVIPGKYEVIGNVPKVHSLNVVEIREIFSFTCPHCFDFNNQLPTLRRRFGKKIKIIGHPIGWAGPNPGKLYYIALTKGVQDDVKDFIFSAVFDSGISNINDLKMLSFIANQYKIGPDFERLINDPKIENAMKAGQEYAKARNITSTPTLVIENGLKMHGDIENLSIVINALLKEPVKY